MLEGRDGRRRGRRPACLLQGMGEKRGETTATHLSHGQDRNLHAHADTVRKGRRGAPREGQGEGGEEGGKEGGETSWGGGEGDGETDRERGTQS